MTGEEPFPGAAARLRAMRIIHGALVASSLTFAVIAFVLGQQGLLPPVADAILAYVGAAFAAVIALASLVLPPLIAAGWRRQVARGVSPVAAVRAYRPGYEMPAVGSDPHWWGLYQTQFLIRAALLESAVFFLLVAYLMTGAGWTLGVAAFFLLWLALLFPTLGRVQRWVQAQKDLTAQVRGTG
jgi:hypothetical protein